MRSDIIKELSLALIALGVGFGLMPLVIFLAGSALLGHAEGANSASIYDVVYRGLGVGSPLSWMVVLGPYVLYLVFTGLRHWWRASARLA